MIKVLKNVLSEKDWTELNNDLNSPVFTWYYQKTVADCDTTEYKAFYFTHGYINLEGLINSEWANNHNRAICSYLTNYFKKDIDLFWSKSNMFTRMEKNYVCGFHTDVKLQEKLGETYTLIYYVNTNNGGTQIQNGPFIPSVKNTAVLMSGDTMHSSVVQTDTNVRLNMNFNFKVV
tara:strand:- start:4 stop:531 length:528 start_codon:yes stop_codon:yes gene_type:complete